MRCLICFYVKDFINRASDMNNELLLKINLKIEYAFAYKNRSEI